MHGDEQRDGGVSRASCTEDAAPQVRSWRRSTVRLSSSRSTHILQDLEQLGTNLETFTFGERRKADKTLSLPKYAAEWSCVRLKLLWITESSVYNVAMVSVIILNVAHLWQETDLGAQSPTMPAWMIATSQIFLGIYTLDLLLRIFVHRSRFPKSGMNIFDTLVVMLDILLTLLPGTQRDLPSLSVLRGLRMLRIVRVIRNLAAFRELYLMMQGIVSAVRAIIFGTVLIFATLILWSVLAVELVQEENFKLWEEGVYGDCFRCANAFESVGNSMLTFISTIIAGDSWGVIALPLIERKPWTGLILLPAMLSLELGLLNVVAAVIVDRQAQARQDDEKFLHHMRSVELKKSYGRLKALFNSMDDDGSGSLTLPELLESFRTHADFKELMELMDIQEDDLPLVFQILDKDRSGDVTYDEFVEQLNTMRTTNSHTLLVFIKHLAGRISEQADKHDKDLKRIQEAMGLEIGGRKARKVDPKPEIVVAEEVEDVSLYSDGAWYEDAGDGSRDDLFEGWSKVPCEQDDGCEEEGAEDWVLESSHPVDAAVLEPNGKAPVTPTRSRATVSPSNGQARSAGPTRSPRASAASSGSPAALGRSQAGVAPNGQAQPTVAARPRSSAASNGQTPPARSRAPAAASTASAGLQSWATTASQRRVKLGDQGDPGGNEPGEAQLSDSEPEKPPALASGAARDSALSRGRASSGSGRAAAKTVGLDGPPAVVADGPRSPRRLSSLTQAYTSPPPRIAQPGGGQLWI